jgi:hypothetical protein
MYKWRVCVLCTNGETNILDWETNKSIESEVVSEIMKESWIARIDSIRLV